MHINQKHLPGIIIAFPGSETLHKQFSIISFLSKANLDAKILLVDSTGRPRNQENVSEVHIWEQGFHIPLWSVIYLLLKLKCYF